MIREIEKLLREHLGDDTLTVTETTTLQELNLDSLDTVDLVMNLEDAFEVTLEMDENIKTVGDLVKAIEAQKE